MEILYHIPRESEDSRGIVVNDEDFKVLQYADDTTLFVDEDLDNVINIIKILKWFKSVSGLDINNKIKVVRIGALRESSIQWQGKFGFKWSETFEICRYLNITKSLCEVPL